MGQNVKCDQCGKDIKIQLEQKQEGDLEYQFFTCPHCKTSYVVTVTDSALRREMQRYSDLVDQSTKLAEQARELLQQNVKRSRELMDEHPMNR